MRAALLYTLCVCSLFNFGFSNLAIESFENEVQQCSQRFFRYCKDCNGDKFGGSVLETFCLPEVSPSTIPINYRQCYSTCTFPGDGGFPRCTLCDADESRDGSLSVTERPFYSVYRLRSPGHGFYGPNLKCDYRVQCKPGQSLYFQLVFHDLEPPPFPGGRCPDTLSIYNTAGIVGPPICGRSFFGRTYNCFDEVFATFASNGKISGRGFFAYALCASNELNFRKGCEYFDLPQGPNPRDEHLGRDKRSFRTPHFTVKPGQVVRYFDNTVIVEWTEGKVIHTFKNIRVLQTYNQFERFVTYKNTAGDRSFPGFGKLRIGHGIVQYIQSDIDPRFIPSAEETRRINILLGNLTAAGFFDDEQFSIILPNAPTGVPGPTGGPGSPGVPGTPPAPDPCSNLNNFSTLRQLAVESTNSCNGFLSATADFFLETTARCNSTVGPVL